MESASAFLSGALRIAHSISACSYLYVPVAEKQKHICGPPLTYVPTTFDEFPFRSRRPRIEHIVTGRTVGIRIYWNLPEVVLAARIEHEW